MRNKILLGSVSLILILTLVLTGCAKTTPAPAPAPTPDPTPAPAPAPVSPIELKLADIYTSDQTNGRLDDLFAKMVADKTGGRVKVTVFHSESLGKQTDFINMVKGGVADIAQLSAGTYPSQFEFENGLELPFLGIPSRAARSAATWDLFNKGYLKGLNDFKVLGILPGSSLNIFVKKKATAVADFQGLKIRGSNATMLKFIESLGAAGMSIPGSELYMSLERGVIDGVCTGWEFILQMKMYEVVKNCVWNPPLSQACMFMVMNKDKWNAIPKDLQTMLDQVIVEYDKAYLADRAPDDNNAPELMRKQGMEVYDLSADVTFAMIQKAAVVKNDWITQQKAKGLPAQEMMDALAKFLSTYK